MKNKSVKITLQYISTIVFIVLIVLALNYGLFLFFIRWSPSVMEPAQTVKALALELHQDNHQLSLETAEMIKNNNLWVQLVDPKGDVIYDSNKPNDIGGHYSLKDIAVLSRNFLNDYPVFVWESGENLVLLGYPKDSISRYNWYIPTKIGASLPSTFLFLLLFNVAITVIVSIFLGRRLTKPLTRLINAVFLLKQEKEVYIEEKGVYMDLAQSITETSRTIIDKNNKIRLRDAAVTNWVAGISHDVRTPLSMILGYSALMEEDAALPEEIHSQAKIITENALRLRELVTDLNLATSLQYNMQPLTRSRVRLGNIAREAMASCINSGVLQNCRIDGVIEDENTVVLLDDKLFLRAVVNLIMNSAKHNKNGCCITVTVPEAAEEDPYASLRVSDNGCGIPQDTIKRVTQHDFFNFSIHQTNGGLGLIIVRSIVEAHHGKLIIESEIGKGTVVILKIPKTDSLPENEPR